MLISFWALAYDLQKCQPPFSKRNMVLKRRELPSQTMNNKENRAG